MIEYAGGNVNALDTISFYENGKMCILTKTGKVTVHVKKSNWLNIYNSRFSKKQYKKLKLDRDRLIKQKRRKKKGKPQRRACK